MKTRIYHCARVLFSLLLFTGISQAQPPQGIRLQGVIRNALGEPLSGPLSLKISLYNDSINTTPLYSEIFTTTTDDLGLFSVTLGQGTPDTGQFNTIDWEHGAKFIKMEYDSTGGTNFILLGTEQIYSVPYALYSGRSSNGLQDGNSPGNTMYWNGTTWINDSTIYNNGGNVGIGTNAPASRLSVMGNLSVGDSAAGKSAPPNGLRVDGSILIGTQQYIITGDGGFIVIDDGRVRRHRIGMEYKGDVDSSETNTGIDLDISASHTVTGSNMNLKGTSDSSRIIGNHMWFYGPGNKYIGTVAESWPDGGDFDFNDSSFAMAVGSDYRLAATSSVTGTAMNLKGGSDSAVVVGNTVEASGGEEFTGFKATLTEDELYMVFATGVDVNLNAKDSVIGNRMKLKGNSDTAVVIGTSVEASGGEDFTGFKATLTEDELYMVFATGVDVNLNAKDSVLGSRMKLKGNSDTAVVIGTSVEASGGEDFTGFKATLTEDELYMVFATGVDVNLNAKDSVIGNRMKLKGNSDTAVVIGTSVEASGGEDFTGFKATLTEDELYMVFATGVNINLNAKDSVIGSTMNLKGGSDSSVVIGHGVTVQGKGNRTTGYQYSSILELIGGDPFFFHTSIGSDMNIAASDSVTGSKYDLTGGTDSTILIGSRIVANGQGREFTGIIMRATEDVASGSSDEDHNDVALRYSLGSDIRLSAKEAVTGHRASLSGTSDSAKISGLVIIPDGTGSEFTGYYVSNLDSGDTGTHEVGHWMGRVAVGSDIRLTASDSVTGSNYILRGGNASTAVTGTNIKVNGGNSNIGIHSIAEGNGAAGIFSGTGGANGLLVPSGKVGIGTSQPDNLLHIHGTGNDEVGIHLTNDSTGNNINSGVSLKVIQGRTKLMSGEAARIEFSVAGSTVLLLDTNGNIGIGNTTPSSLLSVGENNSFRVDSTGDLIRINSIPYEWPFVQGLPGSTLKNDGNGILTWGPDNGISVPYFDSVITVLQTADTSLFSMAEALALADEDLRNGIDDETFQRLISDSSLEAQQELDRLIAQTRLDSSVHVLQVADSAMQAQFAEDVEAARVADSIQQAQLINEALARYDADSALHHRIDSSEIARYNAETALHGRIDDEIAARTNADSITTLEDASMELEIAYLALRALQDSMIHITYDSTLYSHHSVLDSLSSNFYYEIVTLVSADSLLQSMLNAESVARLTGDSTLYAKHSEDTETLQAAITADSLIRVSTDGYLQAQIDSFIDSVNDWVIPTLQSDLGAETAARLAADSALQAEIDTEAIQRQLNDAIEALSRTAADSTLQAALAAETAARIAATPQVSFQAGLQVVLPVPNNVVTTVPYNLSSFNDGSGYNPGSGIFTAPSTGKYHFDASVMWQQLPAGAQPYTVMLNVNGVNKKTTYNIFNLLADYQQALSIDLALTVGDQVKVTVHQLSGAPKNLLGNVTTSTFSGHQLY